MPLSVEAQRWHDELAKGWEWEPHEREILLMAAQAWDRFQAARARLDQEGTTFLDRFGQLKLHPCHVVERDARSAFLMALSRLKFQEPVAPAELLALPRRLVA